MTPGILLLHVSEPTNLASTSSSSYNRTTTRAHPNPTSPSTSQSHPLPCSCSNQVQRPHNTDPTSLTLYQRQRHVRWDPNCLINSCFRKQKRPYCIRTIRTYFSQWIAYPNLHDVSGRQGSSPRSLVSRVRLTDVFYSKKSSSNPTVDCFNWVRALLAFCSSNATRSAGTCYSNTSAQTPSVPQWCMDRYDV